MINVGDEIEIISMRGEPQYSGKTGFVTLIDDIGQIHGTWGGCALIEEEDDFKVIQKARKCSICGKPIIGYGNNAYPINDGECCDECNAKVVIPKRMEQLIEKR